MAWRLRLAPEKTNFDFFKHQWLTFGGSVVLMIVAFIIWAMIVVGGRGNLWGIVLGTIYDILFTGANEVYIVRSADSPNEVLLPAIDEVVRVAPSRRVAGAMSRPQHLLAGVGHEDHLAFEHPDEFVLERMPVAQRRLAAGREFDQVHAETGEAQFVAESPLGAVAHPRAERLRIPGSALPRHLFRIECGEDRRLHRTKYDAGGARNPLCRRTAATIIADSVPGRSRPGRTEITPSG